MRRRRPADETLVTLRGRLEDLPARSAERQRLLQGCADLHGVSIATVYRALREQFRPRSLHRRDRGRPRKLSQREMERFCELVAAMKLRTPLQIEQHLTLALETGYQASEKPVGEALVDSVLSKQIDDLEPTLTRHGYTAKVLTEMLGTKPGEIKALFKQTLEADRARELKEQMLAAGLPV